MSPKKQMKLQNYKQ